MCTELAGETKFLREHCERLHVQLAEGQATLSKLCLTLSSLVETQRKFKEENSPTMTAIDELQSTLKLLQSPHWCFFPFPEYYVLMYDNVSVDAISNWHT